MAGESAGGQDGTTIDTEVDLVVVTMHFDTDDPEALLPILSRYVVMTRGHDGCRNVDFVASATRPGRFGIVQKWETPDAQQAHFDSPDMVAMAKACDGLLRNQPEIDLLEAISVQDLE